MFNTLDLESRIISCELCQQDYSRLKLVWCGFAGCLLYKLEWEQILWLNLEKRWVRLHFGNSILSTHLKDTTMPSKRHWHRYIIFVTKNRLIFIIYFVFIYNICSSSFFSDSRLEKYAFLFRRSKLPRPKSMNQKLQYSY